MLEIPQMSLKLKRREKIRSLYIHRNCVNFPSESDVLNRPLMQCDPDFYYIGTSYMYQ